MMRLILLILLIASCSSTEKKKAEQDEYEHITNDLFKTPEARTFSVEDDFLDQDIGSSANVLYSESVSKIDAGEISEVSDVNSPLIKGLVACYKGQYKLADKIFDETLKRYRKNPIYWTQVANCFLKKGNKRKALLYYNKAKEFKSKYAPPVNNIGVILERKDFPQKALLAYEEAMDIASFSLTPMFNTAILYTRYSLASEAKELLIALRKLSSEDYDATASLAYLEMVKGNYKKSLAYYKKISSKYYKRPEVGVNLALTLYLSGQKTKAKKVINSLNETNNQRLTEYILQVKKII